MAQVRPTDNHETIIMDGQEMARALTRMAHEILEGNKGSRGVALVGIRTGGVFLAQRLQRLIRHVEQTDVGLGELDITPITDEMLVPKGVRYRGVPLYL